MFYIGLGLDAGIGELHTASEQPLYTRANLVNIIIRCWYGGAPYCIRTTTLYRGKSGQHNH